MAKRRLLARLRRIRHGVNTHLQTRLLRKGSPLIDRILPDGVRADECQTPYSSAEVLILLPQALS